MFWKKRGNKRGGSRFYFGIVNRRMLKSKRSMELEEIGKIAIAVFVLVIVALGIWLLLKGRGGEALDFIRKVLRGGR